MSRRACTHLCLDCLRRHTPVLGYQSWVLSDMGFSGRVCGKHLTTLYPGELHKPHVLSLPLEAPASACIWNHLLLDICICQGPPRFSVLRNGVIVGRVEWGIRCSNCCCSTGMIPPNSPPVCKSLMLVQAASR